MRPMAGWFATHRDDAAMNGVWFNVKATKDARSHTKIIAYFEANQAAPEQYPLRPVGEA